MISSVSQSVKQSYSGMPTVTKRRLSEAHQRSFWVYIAVHTLPSTLFLPHVVCLHASFLPLSRPLQLLLFVLLSSSCSPWCPCNHRIPPKEPYGPGPERWRLGINCRTMALIANDDRTTIIFYRATKKTVERKSTRLAEANLSTNNRPGANCNR